MCHSRANNHKINRLHERCPITINFVKESLYETLLKKDGCVSIHNRNIQIFAVEMYKVSKSHFSLNCNRTTQT